ncbi:MAG: glycosyltransferase [Caulobacterales bacterium]
MQNDRPTDIRISAEFDDRIRDGDAARDARRWAEAHRHYAAALALRPDTAGIWVQNGHALKESGDLAGAEAAYRAGLRLEPDNGDTYLQLGHVLKMQDRIAEAVAAYMSAQRLMPGSPDPARELAHQGASAAQGRDVGHNQDLLRSLMIELRAARERLDRIEASLPSIEALTAFAPSDYATFREVYRTPPPPDAGRLACRALIIADLSGMRLPQARAVCEGLRGQRHPFWRAVVIGADAACASLVRQYAALDSRLSVVEDERGARFYPAAKLAAAAVDDFAPDWLVLTPPGFALAEHGLDWLLTRPSVDLALTFGDADALVGDAPATARRVAPVFRSGFDLDLAVQADVVGACLAVRADVWRAFDPGGASDEDAMRLLPIHAARSGIVRHVPVVVATHVAGYDGGLGLEAPIAWPTGTAPDAAALAEMLAAASGFSDVGFEADPLAASAPPQMVRKARRREAIIEVVIPTRDRLDLLRPCVENLEARARGGVIATIVDNGSREPETLDWLAARRRSGGRVLEVAEPFNWSRLNNLAAAQSHAEILLFLNNDTVMLTPDWDDRLRGQIERAQVGAVGARLLYPDLTIQHAGVVAGFEDSVVHEGVGAPAAERGVCGRWAHARAVGAVTGAFLALERRRFADIGGFDERELMVAFSDIDLCFKLRAASLKIIYEPAISLIHHESKSRGYAHVRRESLEREKVEKHISATRWAHALTADPALNPHWNRWGRPMATIRSPSALAVEAYLRLTGSANPWLLDPPSVP